MFHKCLLWMDYFSLELYQIVQGFPNNLNFMPIGVLSRLKKRHLPKKKNFRAKTKQSMN